jgi:hypothetical protein
VKDGIAKRSAAQGQLAEKAKADKGKVDK